MGGGGHSVGSGGRRRQAGGGGEGDGGDSRRTRPSRGWPPCWNACAHGDAKLLVATILAFPLFVFLGNSAGY